MTSLKLGCSVGLAMLFAAGIAGCDWVDRASADKPAAPVAAPPVPVTIGRAERQDVPIEVSAIGWVEPFATVTMKAQVGGQLQEIHFAEGDDVTQGQVLFTIDPRPYESALHLREANLKRDEAMAEDARREAARLSGLYGQSQASERERNQSEAIAEARQAQVLADEAEVEEARLRLAYCTIRSPLDGRAGAFLVHRGSILKADETELVVLNQIEPIYVAFSVPEQYLAGITARQAGPPLSAAAAVAGDAGPTVQGVVTFYDNQVDTTTGTVRLKARFENKDRKLWPGRFVNVTLKLGEVRDAVVVPSTAIQAGQKQPFVYVVDERQVVEPRGVRSGLTAGGRTVVEQGLSGGEIVVIDGQLRLTPGAVIEPKNELESGATPATQPATGGAA